MKKQKSVFIWLPGLVMILVASVFLSACHDTRKAKEEKKAPTIVVAKLQDSTTRLYFKGSLAPIRNIPILSPVDGTITKLYFKYGDFIKQGQEVAAINSTQLATDYRQAVTKYLQAKDTYENGIQTFAGTEALHKAGVISTDEYTTSRSQYETNTLNYFQAKFDLEKILDKAGVPPADIEKLSLVDTSAINKLLQRHFTNIMVKATGDGVALFPVASDSGGDDKNRGGKLTVGAQVKESQLILSVGDLSGFSVTLQVSEISINQIKTKLNAIVTGDAFPGIALKGQVASVADQANPDQSGGGSVSLFNIVVEIPDVPPKDLDLIHVGMTATVEIDIKNPPHILIPISAVFKMNGQSMVTIVDPKTQQQKNVPVVTGDTTLTDVVIQSGINPGDQVVLHD